MKIDRAKSTILKNTFKTVYQDVTTLNADDIVKGKITLIKQLFVRMAESMSIREEDRFEEALGAFEGYLRWKIPNWLEWKHASPDNLFGVLNNKAAIDLFILKRNMPAKTQEVRKEIKKTADQDAWGF